jgi:hypothetical protein
MISFPELVNLVDNRSLFSSVDRLGEELAMYRFPDMEF